MLGVSVQVRKEKEGRRRKEGKVYTDVCDVFFNHLLLERVGEDSRNCNGLLQRLPHLNCLRLVSSHFCFMLHFRNLFRRLKLISPGSVIQTDHRHVEDEDCDTTQITKTVRITDCQMINPFVAFDACTRAVANGVKSADCVWRL